MENFNPSPVYVVLYNGVYYDKEHELRSAMEVKFYNEGHLDDLAPEDTAWWVDELESLEIINLNDPDRTYDWVELEELLGWLL
jgi:hypothetical protein